jgi:hypothetical protein
MTDDQADGPGTDGGAKKRPPPTIELEASEVSGDTQASSAQASNAQSLNGNGAPPASRLGLAMILPALAGAVAALVVVGMLWAAGVIGPAPQQVAAVPPAVASGLNDLSDRIGKVETKLSAPPPATDGGLRTRVDTLESAANTLRDQSASLRKQVDSASAALNELKAAPRDGSASPDLAALTERLARIEQAMRALPDKPQAAAPASDDLRPRRLVIATVLETKVRRGEPYVAALAAAKAVAEDKAALAPLDADAETGVPTDAVLAKDLLALLPQLSPQASAEPQAPSSNKGGLLGHLASNASKLVRVERADAPETTSADVGADLQAVAAAAQQNNVRQARAAIEKLSPDLKARLQPWLDRVKARDAALQTVTAFSASALSAMSKAD